MKDLPKILDYVANKIEKEGYIKEALELDVISNTIEKSNDVGLSKENNKETETSTNSN